jgi:hypothetical protein
MRQNNLRLVLVIRIESKSPNIQMAPALLDTRQTPASRQISTASFPRPCIFLESASNLNTNILQLSAHGKACNIGIERYSQSDMSIARGRSTN